MPGRGSLHSSPQKNPGSALPSGRPLRVHLTTALRTCMNVEEAYFAAQRRYDDLRVTAEKDLNRGFKGLPC
jgi:hypothetical protein